MDHSKGNTDEASPLGLIPSANQEMKETNWGQKRITLDISTKIYPSQNIERLSFKIGAKILRSIRKSLHYR